MRNYTTIWAEFYSEQPLPFGRGCPIYQLAGESYDFGLGCEVGLVGGGFGVRTGGRLPPLSPFSVRVVLGGFGFAPELPFEFIIRFLLGFKVQVLSIR